ncbi:hypothetical protein QMK19_38595 [Streptomyces sp. H10-C2]|uniref:hypothetical protein n=1 Tax=unclassified Streptomyces TaxID=2593676 RepID=UPI0024BA7987|nr:MULTISPECIES: hypothetical protein [unclassified Streptomyces]MDJ0346826.1 hypothetical protein [Streptomyces sp. PH10-H1]MDJ0375349.1 hypothetical protein [Streptomyces sp. H10-C2]
MVSAHTQDDVDEVAAVTGVLLAYHPTAQRDASRAVVTSGFVCSPGAPGSGAVRVGHRCPFPTVLNGRDFPEVAAEEFVFTSAYADLLRNHGWTVRDVSTTRPCLLVARSTAPAQSRK